MWVIVGLVLGGPVPALSQESDNARTHALSLFNDSAVHYKAGRYSVAAALLEEAYALYPEPKLLYNLGRARESQGEAQRAVEAYEAYLKADPASEKRPEVVSHLAALRRKLENVSPGPTPDPLPHQAPAAVSPPPKAERRYGVAGALAGTGVAALGAALAVGLLAEKNGDDAALEPKQVEASRLHRLAERRALASNVLAGAGAVLAVAGTTWLVVAWGGDKAADAGRRQRSQRALVGPTAVRWVLQF